MTLFEELYVNEEGFKCVKSQLAKTDGRDPQAFERVKRFYKDDPDTMESELGALEIRAPEHARKYLPKGVTKK